jgi:hypothetical protein
MESAHHGLALLAGRSGKEAEGFYHLATAADLSGDYERALSQYARAEALLPHSDVRLSTIRDRMLVLSEFLRVTAPTPGAHRGPTRRAP